MEEENIQQVPITRPLLLTHQEHHQDPCSITLANDNDLAVDDGNASVTAFLVFSTVVAAASSFLAGYALGYSSPAESGILADLNLSLPEYSVFGSMLAVGGMMGALVSGKIADFFGRRAAMWIMNFFFVMGWLVIAFTKEAWLLDLGRLLLGIGVGLATYAGNVFLAETTPKNFRGGLMILNSLMTSCSVAISFLIGSTVNWRILALIGCIPCLLQIVGLFFIPESPRWLLMNCQEKEFLSTLRRLRGRKADISREAAEIKVMLEFLSSILVKVPLGILSYADYTKYIQLVSEDNLFDLFQRKYARPITVGFGLLIVQQFSGLTAFSFYLTNIFYLAHVESKVGLVVVAIVKIFATILALFAIDKFGRRTLLMVSTTGTFLGCFLTGFSFLLQGHHSLVSILALTGVLVYMVFFNLGVSGIPWIMISEIFPINVKGSAGSLCNLLNWFCTWVVSYAFNFLMEWNSAGTFFIFSAVSAVGVLFIAKLVPETKGRSLEEIQASILKH